jgi:hypothetical protein
MAGGNQVETRRKSAGHSLRTRKVRAPVLGRTHLLPAPTLLLRSSVATADAGLLASFAVFSGRGIYPEGIGIHPSSDPDLTAEL